MIWTDHHGLDVTTCPVLAFTPEVESALRWFDATHELTNADGRFWFRRTGLPGPGAVGDQDAKLMEAIDLLEAVHRSVIDHTKQHHG